MMSNISLYCDGASRGNPGQAGCGYIIKTENEIIATGHHYLGIKTNNEAEYFGLIYGLEKAQELALGPLTVRLDSELIVKQMKGIYRVKSAHLKPLSEKAKSLLTSLSVKNIEHVRRGLNKEADELANLAIDTKNK